MKTSMRAHVKYRISEGGPHCQTRYLAIPERYLTESGFDTKEANVIF